MLPPVRSLRQADTHRYILARYADESVLARLTEDRGDLDALFELDMASNDRLLAENGRAVGIGAHELVFGVPHHHVVNAAFCHAHPLGGRFNGPDRGAWYAAFDRATAEAEVAYRKWLELVEVDWLEETVSYTDFLADFGGEFHDLRERPEFARCLDPESYVASQKLAEDLLAADSLGVVYPSVRRKGGTCLVCFRPPLVANVRKDATYEFVWSGSPVPAVRRTG